VDIAVLASSSADERTRAALSRACERLQTPAIDVADAERVDALRAAAARPGIRWIVLVDGDAIPAADAFGRLRRTLAPSPAIVGGRGMIFGRQHFGAMFAPPRYGPHPFEISPVSGLAEERGLADIVRGPVDIPQRGLFVVSADFVRGLPADLVLDPSVLALDLAVQARVAGAVVVCEPTMSFVTGEESIDARRRLLDLGRFAAYDVWQPASLHREPASLRSHLIDRDTRIMGNFRGYAKRRLPPIETITYTARDANALRTALGVTGDRYVLCVPAGTRVTRTSIETLVERVERSSRFAIALEHDQPPYGAVLVHAGRLPAGGTLRGDTSSAVLADAIATLPHDRLAAVGPGGPILPDPLPPLPAIRSLDVIFVAASQPVVMNQTIASLVQEQIAGTATAIYPAGAATIRRLLASYGEFRLAPDAADPILAVGLNAAIAASQADAVAVVRDDVNLTRGVLRRLCDAFARVARLGVAVPRTGGVERPEGLPDISYGNATEMQTYADRRAMQFAREAMLVETATVPALVISRRVLDVVGGFDEAFGFSRFGIEDFARRVRAANFHVARCDDAYVHVFPVAEVQSFLAPLDTSPALFARFSERWSARDGFHPGRDVVPLRAASAVAVPGEAMRLRLLVPVASEAEWAELEPALEALTQVLRAGDPVDIAIGLDGTFSVGSTVAALRELLVRSGIPMEETVNVLVEPVTDVAAWRDAHARNVRLALTVRDELAAVAVAADVEALRMQFGERQPV